LATRLARNAGTDRCRLAARGLVQSEHVPKPAGVPGHPKKSTEPARFKSGRGFLGARSRGKAA